MSSRVRRLARQVQLPSELLCERISLDAGQRVLDVACGSGNTCIAAARSGCDVVGIDFAPTPLERARESAGAKRVPVELIEADAEDLPFADASFDAVVSVLGVTFTPNHERAAAEHARVCKPGGSIGLVVWPARDVIHDLFKTLPAFAPPPPGMRSPFEWASEDGLGELLGESTREMAITTHTVTFNFRSTEDFVVAWTRDHGPSATAYGSLEESDRAKFRTAPEDLSAKSALSTSGPEVVIPARYTEVIAQRA